MFANLAQDPCGTRLADTSRDCEPWQYLNRCDYAPLWSIFNDMETFQCISTSDAGVACEPAVLRGVKCEARGLGKEMSTSAREAGATDNVGG